MKNNITELLGIFISLIAVVVMAGWILGIEGLKNILPAKISMTFSTALAFFLSGCALYFMARFQKGGKDLALVILPVVCLIILLLMTSLLASTLMGANIGIENLFVKEPLIVIPGDVPGRPSVATMINFVMMAIAGMTTISLKTKCDEILMVVGIVVGLLGFTAVFGYVFDQPLLYFAIAGKSNAMALHTAILFILWALGAISIERQA